MRIGPRLGSRLGIRIASAATVAALAATAAGCGVGGGSGSGGSDGPKVDGKAKLKGTIRFQTWSLKNDKFTPYFTKLIGEFEKQHAGTKIQWVDQPGDGYEDKITSQVSSHSLPDVVNLPPGMAYTVARTKGLLDLKKNVPDLRKTYNNGTLDAYTFKATGDGVYGFPWYLGTDVNYWNKAMLKRDGLDASKPPASFDEMLAQAKTMHDRSGGKDHLMSRAPGLGDFFNAGAPLMNSAETKFTFNTPAAVKVLDKYKAAFKAGYMPSDVLSGDYEGNSALFTKQKVGWTTGTGNYIQTTAQSNPNLAKQIVPSKAIDTPPLYIQGISVSSKSKNLPLALAWAKFVTDDANQAAFVKIAQGFLPGTNAAANSPAFTKSDGTPQGDAAVLAAKSLKDAKALTPAQWTDAMNTYLGQQIGLAMTGKESTKKALDNAVSKANQLLNQ